jgi:beta-lactamase superfamily II metal-dependent hydrolase
MQGAANAGHHDAPDVASLTLPPWLPGFLDIHHISTGRGSCAFLMCPDSTTMMIDAGSIVETVDPSHAKYWISPKPNGSLRPGQWIARYVQRCLAEADRKEIDYFLLTHFHTDHMGAIDPHDFTASPKSRFGDYQLGGLTDVAEVIPIHKIIDRNYPSYNYPSPIDGPGVANYRAFGRSLIERGGSIERLRAGANGQIVLKHRPDQYPTFSVRNLAANGEVWTGIGEETRAYFPEIASLHPNDYPTENKCSLAIKLSYGKFDYFCAGDMDHDIRYDQLPWGDIETPVARAAGPVEVAVANHHGWVNACGPEWVKALRARAYVINAWDSAHPTMTSLDNMLSPELYPGDRAVFATAVKPESKIALRRLSELTNDNGHVVFRVYPDGEQYQIFVLTNEDESRRITSMHGPFHAS